MHIKFIIPVTLLVTLVIQGCSEKVEHSTTIAHKKTAPAPKWVRVQEAQPQFSITLPGELKAYEEANIFPKVRGFIKKLYVDRGSYVRPGQVLAQLEAPEVGQQFAARRSASGTAYQKLLFSRQAFQRLKEASRRSGAVATIELERAYAQYLGDSAAYQGSLSEAAASGQQQRYLRIVAPFSGVITDRLLSEGALVGESGATPIFRLVQQDRFRLTVAVPEKQASAIREGARVRFTVSDLPGKTFQGTLSRTSGGLNPESRSVVAEFDISNAAGQLHAGQYARVQLDLRRPGPSLMVPQTSVVSVPAGVFVVRRAHGAIGRVPVQVGVAADSLVEVFGNLAPGDEIMLKGSEEVKEGPVSK